jgi:hypothetical protein
MHQTNFKHELPTRVDRKVERDAEKEKAWRACCKAIDARDHRTCRCCGKKTNPDDIGLIRGHRHHLVYRSAGGPDTPENVITLCWACHNDEHKSRLWFVVHHELGANGPVEFWRTDDKGVLFLSRRELDVHRVEHD